jgi:DNA-binding CsgD family transcriptional regulator
VSAVAQRKLNHLRAIALRTRRLRIIAELLEKGRPLSEIATAAGIPESTVRILLRAIDNKPVPILHTPEEWCRILDAEILDPDGWRHDNKDWNEPITKEEFRERHAMSTINGAKWPHQGMADEGGRQH